MPRTPPPNPFGPLRPRPPAEESGASSGGSAGASGPAPQQPPVDPRQRTPYVPPMAPPPKYVPMRPRFESTKPALSVKPRKVRGGVKLPPGELSGTSAWAGQRWLRLLEQGAQGPALVEGLQYAREGQTKRFTVAQGKIEAVIQGRSPRPYTTALWLDALTPDQWDKVVASMSEGAIYAAKVLSGELPPNIEDVFAPLGFKLFPAAPADVRVSCSCGHMDGQAGAQGAPEGDGTGAGPGWCKHVCCAVALLAHRLAAEPFLVFSLRGLEAQDLVERLRQRRAVVGAAAGATPIYSQRVAGVSDVKSPPLDQSLMDFWELGPQAREVDMPLEPPQVTHPLLRRLGQSPWTGQAQFPLVGLLASCYTVISEAALPGVAGEGGMEEDGEGPEEGLGGGSAGGAGDPAARRG